MKPEPKYHNPKTGKTQKLFDVLIPVFTVAYLNPLINSKKVYYTVEAANDKEAIDKALQNEEFKNCIGTKSYDEKYIYVYKAIGNYVIGKVTCVEEEPEL
jgi:hypothetical protein